MARKPSLDVDSGPQVGGAHGDEARPEVAGAESRPGPEGPKHAAPSRRARRRTDGRRRRWPIVVVGTVVVVLVAGVAAQLLRPVPPPTLRLTIPASSLVAGSAAIPWPATGQGAFFVPAAGLGRESGSETPVPVASVTKIMTAYVVLMARPLGPTDQGPSLTMTAADQRAAEADADAGDASVLVSAGEPLTERQMLDALMIPSADNIADVLARWVSGSPAAFVADMNAAAAGLGLRHTHFADPSGLDPASVSTAADVVRLAAVAMASPTFAAVVDQTSVTLPVVGVVRDPAHSVGFGGYVGVKSGYTDAAKGCLVLATRRTVGGRSLLVVAAVMGQGGRNPLLAADSAARAILGTAAGSLVPTTLVAAGEQVGADRAPWGASSVVRSVGSVDAVVERGDVVHVAFAPAPRRERRNGVIDVTDVTEGGTLFTARWRGTGPVAGPSLWWRLLHG